MKWLSPKEAEALRATLETLTAERDSALELAAGEGHPVVPVSALLEACRGARAMHEGECDYTWGWIAGCDAAAEAVSKAAREAIEPQPAQPGLGIAGDVLGGPLAGPGK